MIPQVLLLGNGLSRSFSQDPISWDNLMEEPSNKNIPQEIKMPYGLQVILRTGDNVDTYVKKFAEKMDKEISDNDYYEKLRDIISIRFDDILTTNYDFSVEKAALHCSRIDTYRYNAITKHTPGSKRCERKYFMHTYQEVPIADSSKETSRIWHIHGHVKNPDSIILGHYYYGNLLFKYKEHLDNIGNRYESYQKDGKEYPRNSWVDSFILGDVYILGLGLDFAEMDLWWLINRKQREKARHGNIYFYSPLENAGFNEKKELLKVYGVDTNNDMGIVTFNIIDEEKKKTIYKDFYNKAIEDIRAKVQNHSRTDGRPS